MPKGKRSSSKGVEMPTPKWYAYYRGDVLEGEIREVALLDIQRIRDSNKAMRYELLGVGPWFAIKVGRGSIVQILPERTAVGPYLQAHIALDVATALNTIAPTGPKEMTEKMTYAKVIQTKIELEVA